MSKLDKIRPNKQPRRPHFIQKWAESRNLKPGQLAKHLNVDKGLVSRWYGGASPSESSQAKLAAFFQIPKEALFRDPEDEWILELIRGRTSDEKERIRIMIEAAFPRQSLVAAQ